MESFKFPERRKEPRKKDIFNRFAWLRWYARVRIAYAAAFVGHLRDYKRLKSICEADAKYGDFKTRRQADEAIKEIEVAIPRTDDCLREIKAELAGLGSLLAILCGEADELCTFREKCHIIGVSERHMRIRMDRDDEHDTKMRSLIFVHHGEYRGHKDLLPRFDIDMPLWTIAMESFAYALKHDFEVRQRSEEALSLFLTDLQERKAEQRQQQRTLHLIQ